MSQKTRWEIASLCLVSWISIIMIGVTLAAMGVMAFGMTACSEEPTTEYISEEDLDDLIFVK